jgi:hypothetical protein
MNRLTWVTAALLRLLAGLLPAGRREWAQALRAEADEVPAGRRRLAWLTGGLWLTANEAGRPGWCGPAVTRWCSPWSW